MDIDTLRQAIVDAFGEAWSLNDEAHRQTHFEEVFQTGLLINERLALNFDPKLILFAAYFHDMFAWSRVNHHELSHTWMLTTDHPLIAENLEPHERRKVAVACLQHRASFKKEFSSPFAQLINSADRELPGDVESMLQRAIQFRQKNNPGESSEEMHIASITHLKEKFGHGGYARYPQMYLDCFAEELEFQRDQIDRL